MLLDDGITLATYFLLPLVGVNKKTFGRKFRATYISEDDLIYVELSSPLQSPSYKRLPTYMYDVDINSKHYAVFKIPPQFLDDLSKFKEGTYSKFSKDAKTIIFRGSSLPYNKSMSGFKMTHPILHALDNSKVLRDFLKKHLKVEELSSSGELIDKPDKSWYIENVI